MAPVPLPICTAAPASYEDQEASWEPKGLRGLRSSSLLVLGETEAQR